MIVNKVVEIEGKRALRYSSQSWANLRNTHREDSEPSIQKLQQERMVKNYRNHTDGMPKNPKSFTYGFKYLRASSQSNGIRYGFSLLGRRRQ